MFASSSFCRVAADLPALPAAPSRWRMRHVDQMVRAYRDAHTSGITTHGPARLHCSMLKGSGHTYVRRGTVLIVYGPLGHVLSARGFRASTKTNDTKVSLSSFLSRASRARRRTEIRQKFRQKFPVQGASVCRWRRCSSPWTHTHTHTQRERGRERGRDTVFIETAATRGLKRILSSSSKNVNYPFKDAYL